MPAICKGIINNSIAAEVGLEPGDTLFTINGSEIKDILDYRFASQETDLVLEVRKASGEVWIVDVEKDEDEELGLIFDGIIFDRMHYCRNRCLFCFVDQLPPHMRKTLYVKDDDYRYSFLYGNFITLTNLTNEDWEKIVTMRLSPLYVSIHAMRPAVRQTMLGVAGTGSIKDDLLRLAEGGIQIHTQIVLCPGINDGEILRESIQELAARYPVVQSIGIVPVGLTGFRQGTPELVPVSQKDALELIQWAQAWQQEFRQQMGIGLVYLADEFYLQAQQPIPEAAYYDDYPQVENGIGLARILLDEFAAIESDLPEMIEPRQVFIVTGRSGAQVLDPICRRMNDITGLTVELTPVENHFFGGLVSVTGLLTGSDIINALQGDFAGKRVLLPEIVLKEGEMVFLDDIQVEDIKKSSQADIRIVAMDAAALVDEILS